MFEVTPEILYDEYRRQYVFSTKGVWPKKMKNFEKAREAASWSNFEKLSKMINLNPGHIDHKLYITALVAYFQGRVPPKHLSSQLGIKIYKNYVNMINLKDEDRIEIEKAVLRSIKNIAIFMQKNNIKSFNEYLEFNKVLIPVIAKHFYAGSVSMQFMVLIPNLKIIINDFPVDVVQEYFTQVLDKYDDLRSKLLTYEKLRKISDNIDLFIKAMQTSLKTKENEC